MRKPLGRVDGTEQLETLVADYNKRRILGAFRQPRMCQPNFRGGEYQIYVVCGALAPRLATPRFGVPTVGLTIITRMKC